MLGENPPNVNAVQRWESGVKLPPRQVMTLLVKECAGRVIFVHNHPSGDPTPSPEDVRFTRRLIDAARTLDIRVLEHVVVAAMGHASTRETGTGTVGFGEVGLGYDDTGSISRRNFAVAQGLPTNLSQGSRNAWDARVQFPTKVSGVLLRPAFRSGHRLLGVANHSIQRVRTPAHPSDEAIRIR